MKKRELKRRVVKLERALAAEEEYHKATYDSFLRAIELAQKRTSENETVKEENRKLRYEVRKRTSECAALKQEVEVLRKDTALPWVREACCIWNEENDGVIAKPLAGTPFVNRVNNKDTWER